MDWMLWLAVLIIAVGLEMITMGLVSIWFAGGALIALIGALLHWHWLVQVALFLVVSIVLMVFTRPIAVRYFNKDRVKTNVDSVLEQQAIVTEEINNLLGQGAATLKGQEWTARAVNENQTIPTGTIVRVIQVDGVKLIVEPVE